MTDVATNVDDDFQQFLDKNQYAANGILRYEKIFGRGFVSTGGLETTKEFVEMLQLKGGQRVLDVGCGIGGSAFYMEKNFGVHVLGVDLSTNMISIGRQRAQEFDSKQVEFAIVDITNVHYEPESFDVIYSRDTILHIEDKKSLFAKFLTWLKPGGQLLISDYSCGDGEWSDRFKAYVAQRQYHLLHPAAYGKLVESVGFADVKAEDRTVQFVEVLKREHERALSQKEELLKTISLEDFNALVKGWTDKMERCAYGDQKWLSVHARKPVV